MRHRVPHRWDLSDTKTRVPLDRFRDPWSSLYVQRGHRLWSSETPETGTPSLGLGPSLEATPKRRHHVTPSGSDFSPQGRVGSYPYFVGTSTTSLVSKDPSSTPTVPGCSTDRPQAPGRTVVVPVVEVPSVYRLRAEV